MNCRCGRTNLSARDFYPSRPWTCKACQERNKKRAAVRREQRRLAKLPAVERERVPMLPAGPFIGWLTGKLYEADADGMRVTNKVSLAARLGVTPRRLDDYLKQTNIGLDTVDRVLCHYGTPEMLYELYPVIPAWDAEQVAA